MAFRLSSLLTYLKQLEKYIDNLQSAKVAAAEQQRKCKEVCERQNAYPRDLIHF